MAEGGREGNMQVGDGGISNTVEVRGFSIKTSQELMEMYFENSRRSGGGAVEEVKIRDDVAYITFKEAEVAQKVASRGNHQVDGHTLTVTLFHPLPPKPCYQNRVLILGLNIAITEELLRNFLETKTKAQVTEFLYGEEDGNVVVTLSDNIDIVQLGKIFQECSIEGVFLKVARIAISNCILVQNLQPSTSHDVILYYFENKRSGGGDIERVEMKTEERYCLIYFEDPNVTDRVLGQSHNVGGVDFEVHLHHECLGQRSSRKKSDLYLRMSSPGNKDIATLKDEDTDNQTKDKTSSSVSSNPEKESDFVEVQEWQENDGNNCTLPLWIKYKRAPDMKFIKCMKNIPCSWNFHLYWNFFTKSEPGKQMLHEILNKYNCSVAVVAEDEDLFIFEISEKIFEQESDVVQLIHVVLDSVHKCAQQFLYLDNLLVDQRIQGDVLQVVRQRKELDIARFELMGQQDVDALCVICTEKDQTLVLHVVTEIIHKVKECFENHEETIHVDHKWQKVMKTFGYLQKLCEKYPSVTIISDKTEPAIMLKGLRDESKPAADHYLELLGTASSEVQEEIFSPGCQFEIFSYPEMCGYIDNITMELSIVWIPNHQTKKIHLFFKRSEKIKGVDKFIRGCVQERLYPLAKDQTVISTKIFRSLEELKKMHTGKIVFSSSHRGLLLTATDDIFDSIDDAVQEIICKETELQISRVHEEAEGVRTKTTVAERGQFPKQSNENEDRADTTVDDLQPSANGSNVDALGLVKPQTGESPDGSNAGAGIIKTPDANVTQTDSLSDKMEQHISTANAHAVEESGSERGATPTQASSSSDGVNFVQEDQQKLSGNEGALDESSSERGTQIETTQTSSGHGGSEVKALNTAPPQTGSFVQSPSQETSKVKQIVTLFEASNSTDTGTPVKHSTQAGDKEAAEMKLSGNEGALDVSSSERGPQIDTTQTISGHGGGEVKTSSAAPPQTGNFVQMDQLGSADKPASKESGWNFRKWLFEKNKSETKANQLIVKHFYLYLPYNASEIVHVFVQSNWRELNDRRLHFVNDTKHLWGVKVHLNPDILNNDIKYQFGVEKYEGHILRSRVIRMDAFIHTLDSSTIQRKYWMQVSTSGVLDHVQHIMQHCREDMKDSILQLEVLITDLQKKLNRSETLSILNQLEKDNLVDNDCSLIFALLLAKLEYFSFVEKSNENLVTKLFQTLCDLNRSNLPSTSIRCLHELSYYVMAKKLKSKFCLVHWMTYMFPFQPEATFIQEINRFLQQKIPIATFDKESMEMTLEICKKVRERILKEESEKGPEFVLALVKILPLTIAMKVHSDIFNEMSDLVELGEKIQDIIVVKIQRSALKHVNSVDIGKLKSLWKMAKSQRYINLLTGTFEKHLLSLFNRMPSFNNYYKSFFEDEMLFVDDPNKDALLQLIAQSPIREVHEYMKTLTPGKKFLTISDDVVEKWFETALDKYISHGVSSHPIKSMYTYLCDAVLLQQPGNNADLTRRLETKLYNMKIKSLKPAELVKMADEIFSATKGSKLAHEIFQHHLERLLKEKCNSEDPRDILTNVFGKDIWLSSDWQVRLLTTLLDSNALKAVSQTQEIIFSLLPHQNFWKAVLKVQGEAAKKVKMHPSYIAADECISSLRKSLKDMTISVSFLEKIASENLMLEVASVLSDDGFPIEQCLDSLKDYHSCVIKERERTVHVTSTLENIIKYFPAPDDLALLEIKEKVHMVSETLKAGNITIKEMKESLWKPYDSVPVICEKLQTPSKSSVYWKVCLKNNIGKDKATKVLELAESGVEEEVEEESGWQEDTDEENLNYSDVHNTHDENGMPVLEGLTVLKDLYEKGCDLYKEIWEDFYKGSDIPVSFVQEMFGHGVKIPKEIKYIEDFEGNSLNNISKSALLAYCDFPSYKNAVKAMEKSLAAFKIDTVEYEFRSAMQAFKGLSEGDADSITIFQVHNAVKTVKKTSNMLTEEAIELLYFLGESSTLVGFLSDIVDEDIRILIDAVEEVSEKYVNESTVSGLIEVKRFLHPFLIKDSHLRQNQAIFFRAFAEKFQELVFKDAVLKTIDCMENLHNLKSLYNNVANRSARTREITKSIIENGKFNFSLQHHECMLTVSYKQKETISIHLKATLVDLRSRALLLMNTARKEDPEDETEDKQEYLGKYVTYIDLGLEIAELCTSLYVAGHFSFTKFDTQVQPDQLEECRSKLKEELITWQSDIMQCREKYYYMNFFHGGQIQAWYNYIQTESIEGKRAVDTFLKFIHPDVSVEAVGKYITKIKLNISNQEVLMNMGMALEQACKKLLPVRRPIELPESSQRITDSIQERKLLIVSLDEHSKSVVRTVLSLYQNNTHVMPEAHQVLFCRNETVWDEIDLLLKRCLGASKFGRGDSLFCLANVELLSNEYQFQIVDALRKLPKDDTFLLVIIFRGAEHHPFLHEFSECVTRIHPMTEASLQMCLQKECPEVFTVTSEVPGLGKTETIKRHAHKIGKTCITLHISGPLSKYTLVERLSKLNIKEDFVLHIDIGNTPDTEEFDTFLFELLLLHFVSAYTTSVFLTTTSVCIEIANTMNNTLSNSLCIATSFKRKNIQWEGFESFQVSTELHSPIQVICHYLNAVEDGTLDKRDIVFKGTKAPEPLPIKNCIFLLQKYLKMNEINEEDISFTLINSFIRILADQLKSMSCCSYFRISNLSLMLGRKNRPPVKTDLVKAMIKVCLDFAGKSIKGCRESQKSTAALSSQMTNLATSLASRLEGMISWEHTNHLMFLFHSQDIQTLSVLYQSISDVPEDVKTLFKIQSKELLDFSKLNQKELQDILQKVARSNPKCIPPKKLEEMAKYYALTPDNLLKMVLIMLRIRAHIPVIVMGDTGCGKTSLVQYISKICDVDFIVKTIHAGIEEEDIIKAVEDANCKALQSLETRQQIWLFLDEINTNDHIWLLSDIICHHSCLGRKLAPNLVLLSACNPYRLRPESAIHTAGLSDKARTDELSRLLYRVHPLPETMVDYIWDFGSLSRADEKMYIEQMVCGKLAFSTKKERLLADALVVSQEFIRSVEEVNCCVSLRDVRRCTDLTVWFKEQFLQRKKNLKATVQKRFYNSSDIEIRAIILALAHCYHSRLIDSRTREKYKEALFSSFRKHHESKYGEEKIKDIIREEQEDILDRMELPTGVAKNTALQENVFVILISILNRIPIFVVGKPGCSKSLSMQVIRSNLRGPDSKDELIKLMPQLYCVSFQGSESSTSDGIIKVFEKAQKYQESNSQEDVLSVVILDGIGLAEVSRFNPLKVLHSLLEPLGKPHPDVAVVGISNWALDASKMNRAIHLSRPEMDEEELILTGKSISDSFAKSSHASYSGISPKQERNLNISKELKGIASGYFEFVSKQRFRNFFGLRDYYSLVKYFARELANMTDYAINQDVKGKIILKGIQRNFGGLFSEMGLVRKCFEKHIIALHNMHGQQNISVLDLIKENVDDRSARHLLLITTGDSGLGILEKQLKDQGREHVTIYGSKFEEDLTDDYSYRILSRIILCMEQGLVLILKDLEIVYGSLYDMLNQNYIIVGNKKNCRIALGPYSNPMCYVHDDFKCIVLVEESDLDHSDPPFLNRFEKQSLQYSEILGDENEKVVSELEHWVASVSSIAGKHFTPEDIIPIYSKDMIPSLVLHVSSKLHSDSQTLQRKIEACKVTLLPVMKPEAIVRLDVSDYGKTCSAEELEEVKQSYFQMPIHEGLEHFLESEIVTSTEGVGKMITVFTNSNIHTDLKKIVPGFKCQIEKLGAFKSEKQLTMQMEQFWHSSDKQILFLQCKADTDGTHILLSKSIIEKLHAEYDGRNSKDPKHVCVIVHLDRRAEEAKTVPQIDFLAKWKLVMLDSLCRPKTKLPELRKWNLMETIELKRPLNDYIKEQLFTAFACIRYGTVGRSIDSISHIITEISTSAEFLSFLEGALVKWIDSKYALDMNVDSWQVQVACDAVALYTASSFIEALERHILSIIFDPLAMLIYELEKHNLLDSFFISDSSAEKRRHIWFEFLHDKRYFTIDDTPLPKGPEFYAISTPFVKLHMPCSKLCFDRIEKEKDFFSELLRSTLLKYEVDEVEELDSEVVEGLCFRFSDIISHKLGELLRLEYDNCQMDYVHDFCTLTVARLSPEDISDEKVTIMNFLLSQRSKVLGVSLSDTCTLVHTTYWKNINVIMAELIFIETCRDLVDIKGVLHEICTVIEEDIEEHYSTESDQMKAGVQFAHYSVSGSVDEGSAHELIRDSHVSEINSRSSEKLEEDEGNTIKKSLEGAIRTKSGQEQRDAPSALPHVLVEKLCKKILPSAGMFESEKDLADWNIKVQNILSFAGRVSQECNVLFGLSFCSDLTSLVLIPYKMGTFWLVQLGNLLQRDVAMDTEEFMEKISEMIIFFGSSNITEQDKQKIFSQFILRCLQAYEDSNVIDWFLYMVERNAVPDDQLTYLKNPLHYACFMEMTEDMSQNIFSQVLDLDPEEACQVLQKSNILSSFNSNIQNQLQTSQHNIPLAVLLVDVFEQEIFHLLHPDIETLNVERLLKVERIIFTEEFSLRQLLAIAYFRRFVKTLGVELQKKEQELNQACFQKLNACLSGNEKEEGSKRLSLQLFLLKVLKSRLRFAQFNKVCQDLSGKLTFISSLWKCKPLVNLIDNAPFALYNLNCYEHARNAFDIGNDELKNFIRNAVGNSDQMLSLHSILIEQFFLKRTVMELTEDDGKKASEVEKLCKECEMDEYNFKLIHFHLGKRDYEIIDVLDLNLHQGSSEIDMQIATFVIELASLALSSRITGCNFILKCFLEPEEILGAFLPGITGKEIRTKLSATKVFLGRCTSHHRFASNIYMTEDQCPKCLNAVVEKNAPITETPYSFEFGMNELVPGTMLTTISQQLLQMIIHGLLTASLAAGYSGPNQISGLLQKRADEGGVAKYLYQSVQKAFRYLEDLMEIRQTDLDYFLHVLLSKTRTLLCKACPAFTEECERNVWEKEFTHIVNSLIHERFAAVREGKRQVLAMHGLDETAIEHQVEEISEVGWCPYLFRLTSEPSLENLSLELYQENNADSFPFLALVLKALPQLELIQHIKPLISWHRACVAYASYHRKKADCIKRGYTVSSFIHEEDDQNQREMLKRKFDSCKKAWEAVRRKRECVKTMPAMDRLHDMSRLENCLILDKLSPMYKVLDVLVSIQNNFIDETLALSVQNYVPALHFLQKDTTCACLPCVSVADVKRNHIINFQWSDRYLKFSQCNIQYGHGRKIAYDFRTIEMELANSLVVGKVYLLLEESFPRIVFTDELYKTYILMIQELKSIIPQQKLRSDIEAGVLSRRERDPKLVADFMNHLGIIISLLRRTGGKPEIPLVDFVDNWSYVLTRPFPKQVLPSPEDAIHLCHIVELNELLEELNADGIIDSLEDEYRVPLEGSSHTFIDGFLSRSVLVAEVVLKAEKRFVHRCLLHREVAPVDSLLDHLRDHYFWPEGSLNDGWLRVGSQSIPLADLFPGNVKVKHISFYIQFLTGKIEYLKSKDLRITHGTSSQMIPGKITSNKSLAKKKQKRLFSMET